MLTRDLRNIKTRVTQTFIEIPSHLIFNYEDLDNPDLDVNILYLRILLYLAHRRDIFVIERLILRHSAIDDGSLLTTSFDLVKVTVMLWIHKNRFARMRRNFEWLVSLQNLCFLGIYLNSYHPAGGIRCSWRWHTLPRTAPANILWHSSSQPYSFTFEHRSATQLTRWFSELGWTQLAEQNCVRRL
jgi:hypothetical protein